MKKLLGPKAVANKIITKTKNEYTNNQKSNQRKIFCDMGFWDTYHYLKHFVIMF